jgi:hypothetical protein
MSEWHATVQSLPPENEVVMTVIDDAKGRRNERLLKRQGVMWFCPDGQLYMYYTPTHWKEQGETQSITP